MTNTGERDLAKRRTITPEEDRAAEYVDSSVMTQRLRYKTQLSVRIDGRYGVYRTHVTLKRKLDGRCTCPSEWWPCKHVRALRSTWEKNPKSFLDLEEYLRGLGTKPKTHLLGAIRDIVLKSPECLGVLGVPGFEEQSEEDPDAAY